MRYCFKLYFSKGVYSFTLSTVRSEVTKQRYNTRGHSEKIDKKCKSLFTSAVKHPYRDVSLLTPWVTQQKACCDVLKQSESTDKNLIGSGRQALGCLRPRDSQTARTVPSATDKWQIVLLCNLDSLSMHTAGKKNSLTQYKMACMQARVTSIYTNKWIQTDSR